MNPDPNGQSEVSMLPSWPHAPMHQLSEAGTFFVTAGTYNKQNYFNNSQRLSVLHRGLLSVAQKYQWQLEAWAVFSNHYHFVAHSSPNENSATTLSLMLKELHGKTSHWLNKLDNTQGRKVWHNFWETRLTYQHSYLCRLSYTHHNPVKHGLVQNAVMYPWFSAAWFERTASPAQISRIYGMKTDLVKVRDEYEPITNW